MSTVSYSIKRINQRLVDEIKQALKEVTGYGSVEIFIQDNRVMQITTRNIRKTNHQIKTDSAESIN